MKKRFLRKAMAMFLAVALVFTGVPMNFVIAEDTPPPPSSGDLLKGKEEVIKEVIKGDKEFKDESKDNTSDKQAKGSAESPIPIPIPIPTSYPTVLTVAERAVGEDPAPRGGVIVYVNSEYKGFYNGGPTDLQLKTGDVIKAIAVDTPTQGTNYTDDFGKLLVKTQYDIDRKWATLLAPTTGGAEAYPGSVWTHTVQYNEASINIYPWNTGSSSNQVDLNVVNVKGGIVKVSYDAKGDALIGTIEGSKSGSFRVLSDVPVYLTADNAELFSNWSTGEVTPQITKTFTEGTSLTANFLTIYEKNFRDDSAKFPIDRANQGSLRAKHYNIRAQSPTDLNNDGYSFWDATKVESDIERNKIFGTEKYVGTHLLKPYLSSDNSIVPENSGFNNGDLGTLYWNYKSYNATVPAYHQAVKFQGFFVPVTQLSKETNYSLRVKSDDGSYGTISIANEDKSIAQRWNYKSAGSENNPATFTSQAGKIYPISIDYFENKQVESVFTLEMQVGESHAWVPVPGDYLYPVTETAFKPFIASPVKIVSPEGVIEGAFTEVKGSAEANAVVKVSVTCGTVLLKEQQVLADKNGDWTLSLAPAAGQPKLVFNNENITIRAAYVNITNPIVNGNPYVEKAVSYPFNFALNMDDQYKIFVNGNSVDTSGVAMTNTVFDKVTEKYRLPLQAGENVIVVQAHDLGSIAGFISSLKYNGQVIKTGDANTWRVIRGASDNYQAENIAYGKKQATFDDTGWMNPYVYPSESTDSEWRYDDSSFGSGNPSWIWTGYKQDLNSTVYFRLVVGEDDVKVAKKVVLKAYEQTPTGDVEVTSMHVPKTGERVIKFKPVVLDQYGHPMAVASNSINFTNLKVNGSGDVDNSNGRIFPDVVIGDNVATLTLTPASRLAYGGGVHNYKQYVGMQANYNGLNSSSIIRINKELSERTSMAWVKVDGNEESAPITSPYTFIVTPQTKTESFRSYYLDQYGQKMDLAGIWIYDYNEQGLRDSDITSNVGVWNNSRTTANLTVVGSILPRESNFVIFNTPWSGLLGNTLKVKFQREASVVSNIVLSAKSGSTTLAQHALVPVPRPTATDKNPSSAIVYSAQVYNQFGDLIVPVLSGGQKVYPVRDSNGGIVNRPINLTTSAAGGYTLNSDTLTLTRTSNGSPAGIDFRVTATVEGATLAANVSNWVNLKITKENPVPASGHFNISGPTSIAVPSLKERIEGNQIHQTFTTVENDAYDQYGQALDPTQIGYVFVGLPNGVVQSTPTGTINLTENSNAGEGIKVKAYYGALADGRYSNELTFSVTKNPVKDNIKFVTADSTSLNPVVLSSPTMLTVPQDGKNADYKFKAFVYDQYGKVLTQTTNGTAAAVEAAVRVEPAILTQWNVDWANNTLTLKPTTLNEGTPNRGTSLLTASYADVNNATQTLNIVRPAAKINPSTLLVQWALFSSPEPSIWTALSKDADNSFVIPGYVLDDKGNRAAVAVEYKLKATAKDQYGVDMPVDLSRNGFSVDTMMVPGESNILVSASGVNYTIKPIYGPSVPKFINWTDSSNHHGPIIISPSAPSISPLYVAEVVNQYQKPYFVNEEPAYANIGLASQTPDNKATIKDGVITVPAMSKNGSIQISATYLGAYPAANKMIPLMRQPVMPTVFTLADKPAALSMVVGSSVRGSYDYRIASQYADTDATEIFSNLVSLKAQLLEDGKLSDLPDGLTIESSYFEARRPSYPPGFEDLPSKKIELPVGLDRPIAADGEQPVIRGGIKNITLIANEKLPVGVYTVRVTGEFMNPMMPMARSIAYAPNKMNDGIRSDIRPATVVKTTDVTVTVTAVPVTPPTPPTPQPQTRGDRGGNATFANVIIADELTPLGAVKFNNAYMVGYPNKTFKPNAAMTRAEAAAVFANVLGLNKNVKDGVKFSDVSTKVWYYGAVQASVKVGLLTTKDGKFNPNAPVTRADMAAAFAKFWELNNIKVSDAATKLTDIKGHWAEKQITQTVNSKLMDAFEDGTFKPDAPATREQTAVMFNKLIARAKINKTKPSFTDVSLDYWAAGDIEAAVIKMNILGK